MSAFTAVALVTFREAFEAVLLTSIILLLLRKTGALDKVRVVYAVSIASVVLGTMIGAGIYYIFRGFPEKELTEAAFSYIAAAVIATVIIWGVRHGPNIKHEVESKLKTDLTVKTVATVTFVFVFREVLETILIAAPYTLTAPLESVAGAVVGLVAALALGFAVYRLGIRINLRSFFLGTSILLAFIAAGLVGYGTHEAIEWLEEEGYTLGVLQEEVVLFDIGKESLLHPSNAVGSVLSVMVGYSPYMEVGRIILQGGTLIALLVYIFKAYGIFPFKNKQR